MAEKLDLFIILGVEIFLAMIVFAYHKNQSLKKLERFKKIVENALYKSYLNNESLDLYIESLGLKYEECLSVLRELIIELEMDGAFSDTEKLAHLRAITQVYRKSGFLSGVSHSLRLRMREVADLNPQSRELVYQLGKEILALGLTKQRWSRISIIVSILSVTIVIWQISPQINQFFWYIISFFH